MLHIRTDGNAKIGTGHVMRCLEIAKAYKETVGLVQFLVADNESKSFIEGMGFPCYKLDSKWDALEEEIPKLTDCKEQCQVECLLIDSYYITKEYVNAWKSLGVKVAYLDDLCKEGYNVDMLINGAIWAAKQCYEGLYGENTKQYLGCKYLPIRKEFACVSSKEMKRAADKILVLSGGTDTYHFLLRFVENMPEEMAIGYEYYLVCGIFNEDYEKILEYCKDKPTIHVLRNVDNLYEYMMCSDVAVSAGGMTLYELSACGTCTITYLLADNQQGNIQGFEKAGLFETIGDIRENIDFENLFTKIEVLMKHYDFRKETAKKLQKLVDGKGAYRIADKLNCMVLGEKNGTNL